MGKDGAVVRQSERTPLVNSMVSRTKTNRKTRICIDPRDPKTRMEKEYFPLKTNV